MQEDNGAHYESRGVCVCGGGGLGQWGRRDPLVSGLTGKKRQRKEERGATLSPVPRSTGGGEEESVPGFNETFRRLPETESGNVLENEKTRNKDVQSQPSAARVVNLRETQLRRMIDAPDGSCCRPDEKQTEEPPPPQKKILIGPAARTHSQERPIHLRITAI
ncbi:hypothetical protein EYF80_042889 [Liparis tanakae]|uniref:Uncharacterized protein n=1 Tax=Liparis tanakae TaxID=230148 RepID=A0A4Z2FZZ7_9TELE|nr:hypothetical protein EYF80_042889 [Liparis tanakae]